MCISFSWSRYSRSYVDSTTILIFCFISIKCGCNNREIVFISINSTTNISSCIFCKFTIVNRYIFSHTVYSSTIIIRSIFFKFWIYNGSITISTCIYCTTIFSFVFIKSNSIYLISCSGNMYSTTISSIIIFK